ncbi:MAG TPA: nucleotidyltransferase family protein [Candidatus Limnocylindria bacterium]|nr:nucleotidyltransferase family protein [Candidatus Limnocylindria bacterium]
MRNAAVILAAGTSTRFGARKQDVRIDGRRMVDIIAATAAEAGLDPVLAVIPPGFDVAPAVTRVVNERPEAGISRSLRLGVDALPEQVDAAVILLGDEPLVDAGILRRLAAAGDRGAKVVAARSGDRIGPPVLLRREAFGLVHRATGDHGLRELLRGIRGLVTVALPQPPLDVDTQADLDTLLTLRRDRRDR